MGKHNILIVEDHALTRFGLKTAFESAEFEHKELGYVNKVFEAENAQKAFDIMKKQTIDVVIMDLGLPDMDGIEATKIIKSKHSNVKIVILSSHELEADVIKSLKAGANAYCTKDIDPKKLLYIVSSIIKGAAWFDPKVAGFVLNAAVNSDKSENEATIEKQNDLNLTTREKQVLTLIVDGRTNIEIAKKLDVSINTAKAHVCNILQKLSVQDRTQAAIKAIKDKII